MSALTTDLDDVEGLIAADRDGLLRSAAMAGAQVRAVSQAQSEGVLGRLAELRPRAVVIVTGRAAVARRAADLVVAVLGPRIDVPMSVVPQLPGWIGPLDVVAVVGDDAGDPALSDAASRALRRRAELVVAVPVEGPVREAVGGAPVADLSPRLPVDPRFAFCGYVAALIAMCTAMPDVRLQPAPPGLADIADRLDAEAAADHPGRESFRNEAKLLALRTADRRVAWAGDTAGAAVVAAHAAATAFSVAGAVAQAADETALIARIADGPTASPVDDIFHDPDFDPPRDAGVRGVLITADSRRDQVERRVAPFGDIDVLAGRASGDEESVGPTPPTGAGADPFADRPADLTTYLVLAVRAELAAVFVRLMGETA
ncbi:hypothetical protein [Gordonia shandongensis]|uniref:hypothetical protein n=1 Tax=Gordonia shandongensis TaxID=376351 RepID=UPI0003FB84BE|nr:hypothetical protein [Gordonia shandongensis]